MVISPCLLAATDPVLAQELSRHLAVYTDVSSSVLNSSPHPSQEKLSVGMCLGEILEAYLKSVLILCLKRKVFSDLSPSAIINTTYLAHPSLVSL